MKRYPRVGYPAVALSREEIAQAREVGRARTEVNDPYVDGAIDPNRTPLEIDQQGALAEFAAAKFFSLNWTGRLWTRAEWVRYRKQAADVGGLQIKSADRPHHRMIIPWKDRNLTAALFVFVLLDCLPLATFVGWAQGSEVMIPRFFDRCLPRAAWAYPKALLHPIDTLPHL